MSYRDACYARGLLADDREYIDAINDASEWSSTSSMRRLFVTILTSNALSQPENVWNVVWHHLAEDAQHNQRRLLFDSGLVLTDYEKKNYALIELEKLLKLWNKSLKNYPSMPVPDSTFQFLSGNRLLHEELSYDRDDLKREHDSLVGQLTEEQKYVYDIILGDVDSHNGGFYFLYGYGGTGKTFVWRTLSAAIRSQGDIVLNVASSGIASLLMPGGRTAHSRFAIPIEINEDSTCNIAQGSDLAELIIKCKLIIWDEAPMMHKHCFEALDRTMRDLMRFENVLSSSLTFGGKTIVLGGDFRQILPVIPKGTRQDIVGANINSSYLWSSCKVLRLTKNLRLQTIGDVHCRARIENFANWIAAIGDGEFGLENDGHSNIKIPKDNLLQTQGDPIEAIFKSTFPNFFTDCCDMQHLNGRAILAPTLDVVNEINEYMSNLNPIDGRTYFSCDTVCHSDISTQSFAELHTPEFLNGLRSSGIPNHLLALKVGSSVMLLRNIDHSIGLCNGTRLVITKLAEHVLEAEILCGKNVGTRVLIPRLSMTPSDRRLPFKFERRQFPLMLSYAMTINKSQGQSLSNVGLFLKKPVFVHGQLYVALSRVNNPNGLKVVILDDKGYYSSSTSNVVDKEVFNNL